MRSNADYEEWVECEALLRKAEEELQSASSSLTCNCDSVRAASDRAFHLRLIASAKLNLFLSHAAYDAQDASSKTGIKRLTIDVVFQAGVLVSNVVLDSSKPATTNTGLKLLRETSRVLEHT